MTVRAAPAAAGKVLVDDPASVLGAVPPGADRRARRFPAELEVAMGAGASLRQEVVVDVGAVSVVDADDGGILLPLSWRAAGRQSLFPAFRGDLEVVAGEDGSVLRLRGAYTVPLGTLGRFGDGVVGRRVARRSLEAFLHEAGRRLDEAVAGRAEQAGRAKAAAPGQGPLSPDAYVG